VLGRDVIVACAFSKRRPLVGFALRELIDGGANLPIAVGLRLLQCRFDVGTFEVAQCNDGSSSNRGAVFECCEDRITPTVVAEYAKCRDGRLATTSVLVNSGNGDDGVERVEVVMFAQGKDRGVDDEGIAVDECATNDSQEFR